MTDQGIATGVDDRPRSNVVPRIRALDVLLVTSGLGPRYGGIGCVSQSMRDILQSRWRLRVVTSPPERSPLSRRARLWSSLFATVPRRPRLLLYEHRGLARIHPWVPWPRGTRYGILLCGREVWSPLPPSQRRILEGADCLLAISQTTVDEARRHNPWLPPVPVVHLGVEAPASRATRGPIGQSARSRQSYRRQRAIQGPRRNPGCLAGHPRSRARRTIRRDRRGIGLGETSSARPVGAPRRRGVHGLRD